MNTKKRKEDKQATINSIEQRVSNLNSALGTSVETPPEIYRDVAPDLYVLQLIDAALEIVENAHP